MKLLDGINIDESNVADVINALYRLTPHAGKRGSVHLTDANGHYVERIKLFEETLSDGSKAHTIELHFSS